MMTPDEIKKAIGRGGAAEIARETDRSDAHVHYVLHGMRRDEVVENAVAVKVGKPALDIFGPVAP